METPVQTIFKAAKRNIDAAQIKWTPGSGVGSSEVECNRNPYSEDCKKALEEEAKQQKIFQSTQKFNEKQMMETNNQYLRSAFGKYNATTKKFEADTGDKIVSDADLTALGIDVNKIREALSTLIKKENEFLQALTKLEQEGSTDKKQLNIKIQELQIKHLSDPENVKAVEELANQFVNLNIVKLYEKQPYWNDFCSAIKPTDEQVEQIKRDLNMAEAVVNSYGKSANKVLSAFVEKIDSVVTNCKAVDPEILSRLRKLHISIKSIIAGYLTASEITELCKPAVAVEQDKMKKMESENKALHNRHMMFITLLIVLLVGVVAYFTVLKK